MASINSELLDVDRLLTSAINDLSQVTDDHVTGSLLPSANRQLLLLEFAVGLLLGYLILGRRT